MFENVNINDIINKDFEGGRIYEKDKYTEKYFYDNYIYSIIYSNHIFNKSGGNSR